MALYIAGWIALAAALAGTIIASAGAVLVWGRRHRVIARPADFPAITLLKPLHGAPSGLETALASALEQDYPGPRQMVCGLNSPLDPARHVVERLCRRFPDKDIVLVIDPRLHGANRKISNLINMMGAAKHDLLVVSDADILAPPNWLAAIAASLAKPSAGVATCFYGGAGKNLWSRLEAMWIGYQFLPNAMFGAAAKLTAPCFGATMALSREMLEEIGGFGSLRDCLADDYELGRKVRAGGKTIEYPPVLVRHLCAEDGFGSLWNHEFRWARTIRTVNGVGHVASLITQTIPLALIGAAILGFSHPALFALTTVVAGRILLKLAIDQAAGVRAGSLWLLPLRDVLSFCVFAASLLGGVEVDWRGDRFRIEKSGVISQVSG